MVNGNLGRVARMKPVLCQHALNVEQGGAQLLVVGCLVTQCPAGIVDGIDELQPVSDLA